ncbi:MAG: hypothetical protein ACLSAP_06810 [Oscillospiraceae bacterium]
MGEQSAMEVLMMLIGIPAFLLAACALYGLLELVCRIVKRRERAAAAHKKKAARRAAAPAPLSKPGRHAA